MFSIDESSASATVSLSMRSIATSSPRPDSTCARQTVSNATESLRGSCDR